MYDVMIHQVRNLDEILYDTHVGLLEEMMMAVHVADHMPYPDSDVTAATVSPTGRMIR